MADTQTLKQSKKEELLDWIRSKDYVYSHDIQAWGLNNYSLRSLRNARSLAQEGRIRKLSPMEMMGRGIPVMKDACWEAISERKQMEMF